MPRDRGNRLTHAFSGLLGFMAAVVLLSATGSAAPGTSPPVAVNPLPVGDGPAANTTAVRVGPQWNVVNWGPGPRAAVPASFAMDTVVDGRTEQKVFVSSQANDDVAAADSIVNMSTSDDSAISFLETKREVPVGALNMVRLGDGSLLALEFIPEWTDDTHRSVDLKVWRSKDGDRWKLTTGRFTPPTGTTFGTMNRGMRIHGKPILLADGTLITPAYTHYQGQAPSSVILQSTDNGTTWTQRGQLPAAPGTNEVGWSFTTDNRLIAVTRSVEARPRLGVSFSSDLGVTWSTVAPLLGPDGTQVVGIFPGLVLQPNGVLLLSTGRPDNRLYVSHDGTGRTWENEELVFTRFPSETGNGRFDGSSGNSSLVSVDSDRSVFIGDTCAVWGCKAYHEQYGVFASYVQATTPGAGRIDLETKVHSGSVVVRGDFARGDRRFPEQRPEGAFDGSSRPRSAAVFASKMVIELDRTYSLNRIGLMLGSGEALDATVSVSADGKRWTPVVVADARRDHALRYTDFAPVSARFVRVTGAVPVTELELYAADELTFENDPLYGIPRGVVDARNTTVSDQELKGHDSSASLRLFDKFTDDNATATFPAPPSADRRVSFQWATNDFRGPFTFEVSPWHFRLVPGTAQTLEVYDGSAWTPLGRLTTAVPVNTWAPIEVAATATTATVTINGQTFETDKRTTDTSGDVTFTTGDPDAYGMTFFVDDLTIH